MNFDIDFITLNILLLVTFIVCGYNISHKDGYWKNAWLCISVFTFVLGSRYLRGNDYEHYCSVYLYDEEESQWLFTFFNRILKFLGVGAHYFYYYYSIIFVSCAMVFLKRFRVHAKYLFPTFLISFLVFDEFMIRQALSFSFVFLYLDQLFQIKITNKKDRVKRHLLKNKKKNHIQFNHRIKKRLLKRKLGLLKRLLYLFSSNNTKSLFLCCLFAAMTISIHVANILILFILTTLYLFCRKPLTIYVSLPLLLFAAFIFNKLFDFSYLNPILNVISGGNEKLDSYIDNGDAWFSDEAQKEQYTRNPIILFFEVLGNAGLLYYGEYIIRKCRKNQAIYSLFYNSYVLGTLVMISFRNLEILNRIGFIFQCFWCFPISLVLLSITKIKYNNFQKIGLFILLFWLYDYLKMLFMRPEMTLFIWDSPYF